MMGSCRKRIGTWALGAVVASVVLVAVSSVEAADDPANVIKYRQKVMAALGAHLGAIAAVVSGEVSFTGHVAAHARAARDTSMMINDVFPEGSGPGAGETRAKPEIWQNWAKFEAAAKTLQDATAELARLAETGDMAAVGGQLNKVGDACGGCHQSFREKKQ